MHFAKVGDIASLYYAESLLYTHWYLTLDCRRSEGMQQTTAGL